ncbi:MAG: hypothetical protein ACE5R6_20500 [Candidatus Heimdallarchaeota archaeon]
MNYTFSSPLLFLLLLGLFILPEPTLAEHEQDLENAATFLQHQYNSTLQLCAEAPNAAPAVYWLWNDNYLAYAALIHYNETMAKAILATLESYGFMKNYAYEALFGQPIELPFREPKHYTIAEGAGYTIMFDVYNGSIMADWKRHANLLCLAALSEHWQQNHTAALDYFNAAAAMWDGIGLCDAENPESEDEGSRYYATYKLALLLYTEMILGQSLSFHEDAMNILWHLQNRTNYGIHTNYDTNYDPNGSDVNVETTSLVIGLFKWPEIFSHPTVSPTYEIGNNVAEIIIVSAVWTSLGSYLLWENRRRG